MSTLFEDVTIISQAESDGFPFDWYAIAHENHFWFQARKRAFLHFIKDLGLNQQADVLEIGCGNGLVRRQLRELSGWKIDGTDINLDALKLNIGCNGKTYLYNIHDRKESFKEKYDYILLFDVLEHIEDTQHFIESCLFHLKKGGIIFINVPALNHLKSKYDQAVGHLRRYDKQMMAATFGAFQTTVVKQRFWAISLVPLLSIRKWVVKKDKDIAKIVSKGLKPPGNAANSILNWPMKTELNLSPNPKIGASLLAAIKKD